MFKHKAAGTHLRNRVGMNMSLKYQGAGVRLVEEGLLIDSGRNIFLIFSTTSKIES